MNSIGCSKTWNDELYSAVYAIGIKVYCVRVTANILNRQSLTSK